MVDLRANSGTDVITRIAYNSDSLQCRRKTECAEHHRSFYNTNSVHRTLYISGQHSCVYIQDHIIVTIYGRVDRRGGALRNRLTVTWEYVVHNECTLAVNNSESPNY